MTLHGFDRFQTMNGGPSREELVELVFRIMHAKGSENELDQLLKKLEDSVPHPEVSDLIFYPQDGVELSPEEIVARALSYKPVLTPPPRTP